MITWYIEFHGPEPTNEIGTMVDATDPDDAIEKARMKVRDGWNDPLLGNDEPVYTFAAWRVVRCVRWAD